jgi:hypothetical protein
MSKNKMTFIFWATIFFQLLLVFNVLPHVFRKISPDLFKMKIEKYLLAKSFYSVEEYLNDNFSDVLTVCNC